MPACSAEQSRSHPHRAIDARRHRPSTRIDARPSTETIHVDDRDVVVTNPGKVLFPQAGYTKLDLVRYYLSVADGALRGSGGRPNILVRYPDGIDGEFFFQKRAPKDRPPWIEVVTIRFPSGRTAEEVVPRHAADLAWMANLACLELHPHPVRADDLDHPDELRVDLDPVPDVPWSQVREVARVVQTALEDHGLCGWPKTSGKRGMHVGVRIERQWTHDDVRRAALALAREVERRVPALATSKWWKEERHGVFIDYNQNAKDRTVAGAYSIRPTPDARVSAPLDVGAKSPRPTRPISRWSRCRSASPASATCMRDIDARAYSLDSLLELSQRHARDGQGDAPWPPQYAKAPDEPTRVQPSRRAGSSPGCRAETADARDANAAARSGDAGQPKSRGPENLLQLVRRRDFELVVAAVARRLVRPPAQKVGRVTKAVALQVIVFDFAHPLDAQRFPRQVLAGGPAALRARHARACVRFLALPIAPRMILHRVLAQRLELLRELPAPPW